MKRKGVKTAVLILALVLIIAIVGYLIFNGRIMFSPSASVTRTTILGTRGTTVNLNVVSDSKTLAIKEDVPANCFVSDYFSDSNYGVFAYKESENTFVIMDNGKSINGMISYTLPVGCRVTSGKLSLDGNVWSNVVDGGLVSGNEACSGVPSTGCVCGGHVNSCSGIHISNDDGTFCRSAGCRATYCIPSQTTPPDTNCIFDQYATGPGGQQYPHDCSLVGRCGGDVSFGQFDYNPEMCAQAGGNWVSFNCAFALAGGGLGCSDIGAGLNKDCSDFPGEMCSSVNGCSLTCTSQCSDFTDRTSCTNGGCTWG